MIESLWLKTRAETDNVEYWYLDYEKDIASKSNQKPRYVNVKKWNDSMENFLKNKGIKILEISDYEIKFEIKLFSQLQP